MKKRVKKRSRKASKTQLKIPQPFKDIKFDSSFVVILLAVLILILSFIIYSHYGITAPKEVQEEEIPQGHECTADMDCAQPKCPGMKVICENGFCIVKSIGPIPIKCFDLKVPVCGNGVCEGDETVNCPRDCGDETELICVENGKCEIDLMDKGYDDNEDSNNCPYDCWCGDDICDDYERETGSCPEDC